MKELFDVVINCLQVMADRDFANGAPHRGAFRVAIKVLEAAGKVDKKGAINCLDDLYLASSVNPWAESVKQTRLIRALIESLPEPEEERKIYRCESCGREFNHKIFAHGRAIDDGYGSPTEVECGPISEVKNAEKRK